MRVSGHGTKVVVCIVLTLMSACSDRHIRQRTAWTSSIEIDNPDITNNDHDTNRLGELFALQIELGAQQDKLQYLHVLSHEVTNTAALADICQREELILAAMSQRVSQIQATLDMRYGSKPERQQGGCASPPPAVRLLQDKSRATDSGAAHP